METYIGTKIINATPMTRQAYNDLRGWTVPSDENPADAGYLVEYHDGGRANHPEFQGYISWSPVDVFEKSYRPTEALTFGLAIEALKAGKKVSRAGWNGKGMWLSLSPGRDIYPDEFWSENARQYAHEKAAQTEVDGKVTTEVLPTILMKTINAHGREAILMGWLASQTDMLSEDWRIVP